jgi:hypothetical protein
MERENRNIVIVLIAVAIVAGSVFIGIPVMSGVSPPQTVVESQSMQHGAGSQIGVIDTGDIVIVKDKNKTSITSFVDGYKNGYSSFGLYGDVIIYEREGVGNNIIHRAILWVNYNGNFTWSAPSLIDYPSDLWNCTGSMDPMSLSGILTLENMGYQGNKSVTLNLSELTKYPNSGYITMGDFNNDFDQLSNIGNKLVSEERIVSVAWIEIPWLGSIKIMMGGGNSLTALDKYASNSVPCLAISFIAFIFLLVGVNFIWNHIDNIYYRKKLNEKLNAPTPIFPLEKK